jgi:hypothetical protein
VSRESKGRGRVDSEKHEKEIKSRGVQRDADHGSSTDHARDLHSGGMATSCLKQQCLH